ncbi:MAG TPA: endonuclease/exonuclease/phosphatase family protein [Acidiferrobacterales bacterium]
MTYISTLLPRVRHRLTRGWPRASRRRVAPEPPHAAAQPALSVTPQREVPAFPPRPDADSRRRLRLLSYNIQTGIATAKYHHYVTHSWKHVLPHPQRVENLNAIAGFLGEFDIVGLQEVDGGSLRSGFVNQTQYLAGKANFPFWHDQTNRDLGKLAQHSIGLLSQLRPERLVEYKLPGMIPGRGVLSAHFGAGESELVVLILHLSLGQRARLRQLAFVSELINGCPHAVVMGDLNCRADSREMAWLLRNTALSAPRPDLHTFPSWRPLHNIDHILVTPSLVVERVEPLDYVYSDHLPLAMDVVLPRGLDLDGGGFPDRDQALAVGL